MRSQSILVALCLTVLAACGPLDEALEALP